MTDLDKIKACARAMGYTVIRLAKDAVAFKVSERAIITSNNKGGDWVYDPFEYPAQADALEGWLLKHGFYVVQEDGFFFYPEYGCKIIHRADMTVAENRRRALVECVAKMMEGNHNV